MTANAYLLLSSLRSSIIFSQTNLTKKRSVTTVFLLLEFPEGCVRYRGPFSPLCLHSAWLETNCLEIGKRHPSKMSRNEIELINSMDLR